MHNTVQQLNQFLFNTFVKIVKNDFLLIIIKTVFLFRCV